MVFKIIENRWKAIVCAIWWSGKFTCASNFWRSRALKIIFSKFVVGSTLLYMRFTRYYICNPILPVRIESVSVILVLLHSCLSMYISLVLIWLGLILVSFPHLHRMNRHREHFHFVSFHFVNILYWVLPCLAHLLHISTLSLKPFSATLSSIQNEKD